MLRLLPLLLFSISFRITTCEENAANKFPENFQFGISTSAYQIEGGWDADGKGLSIWDVVTHSRPDYIDDQQNADIACDSYHKYEEDVELMKSLGVQVYRFSLSWTRLLPSGHANKINKAGVIYYNNLLNKLLENGIEPVVTLFHWDLPERFSALGGWSNPIIADFFADYARVAFELFGDRVKMWLTFNEPRLICDIYKGSTGVDQNSPDFPLGVVEYLCAHNLLKAHAEAYHIYDREFRFKQKGRISLTIDFVWTESEDASPENEEMAEQRRQFDFGLYANPIFNFDYPKVVIERIANRSKLEGYPSSRLPKFTLAEKFKIRGTFDFLGINHYVAYLGRVSEEAPLNATSLDIDGGGYRYYPSSWKPSPAPWIYSTPWALRKLLNWIKKTYNNPEIHITESGYADGAEVMDDQDRITYIQSYMDATLQAIHSDNVNVKGFMVWSLLDNYEWTNGYTLKFGIVHVDFSSSNRTRSPKKSFEFYQRVIQTRSTL